MTREGSSEASLLRPCLYLSWYPVLQNAQVA